MLGFDVRTAELRGFVAGEEDCAPGFFGVSLEHRSCLCKAAEGMTSQQKAFNRRDRGEQPRRTRRKHFNRKGHQEQALRGVFVKSP
jgi:hypothetical protein